jgi:hypothetical protein
MGSKECCGSEAVPGVGEPEQSAAHGTKNYWNYLLPGILLLSAWWLLYRSLAPFSRWVTYDVFSLTRGSHFASAVEFFVFDTPKVLLLLALVVFGVGVARSFFTPDRARRILAGRREAVGNVFAALLGIVTPFCSCSAVPMFIGFVTAGVPLGVTFSFLISAPMVNEVALVLLFGLFGWKIAALYLGTGLVVAMIAGWTIGRLGMEKHVESWVYRAVGSVGRESKKNRCRSRIASGTDTMPSATSWGRSGYTSSSGLQSVQGSMGTFRKTSWFRSWAAAHGGRCLLPC